MSTNNTHASPAPAGARTRLLRWWGWTYVLTTALMCLIGLRYFGVAELEFSPSLVLFRAVMFIAHFGVLAFGFLLPALVLIALVPRPRLVLPIGLVLAAIAVAALIVDTQVYQLYRFHINAGVLNLLFGGAARETFFFSPVMYVQAFVALAVLIGGLAAYGVFAWRRVSTSAGSRLPARVAVTVLVVSILAFHGIHTWADAVAYERVIAQTDVLPLRYAATAKRMLRRLGFQVRSPHTLTASALGDSNSLRYPLRAIECADQQRPPNIVVLMIDSWRFDAMGEAITPNIFEFAKQGLTFTEHYSGGNATRIGVFSFFYGIPGTYWHRVLAEQQRPVLIDELLRRRYDVQVFRSAPLYSPEFDRTVFAGVPELRLRSQGRRPAEWDNDLTKDFLQYLDGRDEQSPFFAFLFYDAPHAFDLPVGHRGPFQPSAREINYLLLHKARDVTPYLNLYRNSVHYVDSLVGEALEALKMRGLLENTIVIITGDHGQEFNDTGQGYWGHASTFSRYQIGVPFILYAPNLPPGTVSYRSSHFDVAPTLMQQYLGCAGDPQLYSVGRSLFEPGGRDTLLMSEYADFAIVQPNLIAVVRKHGIDLRAPNYARLEGIDLAPEAIQEALEQKRRFYKGVPLAQTP